MNSNLRFIDVATLWYGVKIMKRNFIILFSILLLMPIGCKNEKKAAAPEPAPEMVKETVTKPRLPGCTGCHQDVQPDNNHNFGCTGCHHGNNDTTEKGIAHKGLITAPAAPGNMAAACGKCHPEQISGCSQSLHFTVANAVNRVRSHFGIEPVLSGLTGIPDNLRPQSKQEIVDDMLRRRCLRCHVYAAGDSYPYVQRGTGCAACHLEYTDGKLQSHVFKAPAERQCLSCHYSNHVGSDYLGRYENDYNWEYRTPYTTKEPFARPYGVELHQLAPDIHKQRGLTCLDCHSGSEMSGKQNPVSCEDCHFPDADSLPPLKNVTREGDQLILKTVIDGNNLLIPKLVHPAHAQYQGRVACQVCHAQWGFNDRPTHLMLSYSDEIDAWERLTVQSSSEVEIFLEHNLYSDEDELEPAMLDSINGQRKPSVWYLGFTQRRWEDILIDRDSDGIIKVFRPILDLRISAVDEDGALLFDNLKGNGSGLLPYTPHTTGPAGLFYERRFVHLLKGQEPKTVPVQKKNIQLQ